MEVTPEALEEFKRIYKKEFKEEISDEVALEMAQRVLLFFSLIFEHLSRKKNSHSSTNDDF